MLDFVCSQDLGAESILSIVHTQNLSSGSEKVKLIHNLVKIGVTRATLCHTLATPLLKIKQIRILGLS